MTHSASELLNHVVIIGGGFGGLYAAKALKDAPVKMTLIDKRNFHLFQPLLYQVATGGLSPGDIASPLRGIFSRQKNISVLKAEVVDIDPAVQRVILRDGDLQYDTLVVATGSNHHYFGHDEWAGMAPGLKTVEDALDIRSRVFLAFEAAEHETDPELRRAWMTFVVVGGGPTGVELAGAIGELAHGTLKNDFRNIDPSEARVVLLEGTDRVLPTYPADLSAKAELALAQLGVSIYTQCLVTEIQPDRVTTQCASHSDQVQARTILWAAGMQASPLGQVLAERAGVQLDRSGRVIVEPDLSIPGHPNIFVIGDMARFDHQDGRTLPGVAPVAMQQGRFVADLIQERLVVGAPTDSGQDMPHFRYRDKGNLAVIGRNAAVAELGSVRLSGIMAWLVWVFVHIAYLIEFDNKLVVLIQWAWSYFTHNRGVRLIIGDDPSPLAEPETMVRGLDSEKMPTQAEVRSER